MSAKVQKRLLEDGTVQEYTLIPERYYIEVSRPSDLSVDEMKAYISDALKNWRGNMSLESVLQDAKFGLVRVERRPKPTSTVEEAMSTEHMLEMGRDKPVDNSIGKTDSHVFTSLSQMSFVGMEVSLGLTPEGKRQIVIKEV